MHFSAKSAVFREDKGPVWTHAGIILVNRLTYVVPINPKRLTEVVSFIALGNLEGDIAISQVLRYFRFDRSHLTNANRRVVNLLIYPDSPVSIFALSTKDQEGAMSHIGQRMIWSFA